VGGRSAIYPPELRDRAVLVGATGTLTSDSPASYRGRCTATLLTCQDHNLAIHADATPGQARPSAETIRTHRAAGTSACNLLACPDDKLS
jgi:hypothetical protein